MSGRGQEKVTGVNVADYIACKNKNVIINPPLYN